MDPAAPQVDYTLSAQFGLGEIAREESPARSPTRITQTPNHTVDLTATHVSYIVSAQTGLATVVHERYPVGPREFQTDWSTDQNQLSFQRLMGSDRVFSSRVGDILSQWHDLHPDTKPPCAYSHGNRLPLSCKILDRDGEEHEFSEIKVSVHPRRLDQQSSRKSRIPTLRYKTLILHSDNGPDELITIINRSKSDREKRIALFVDPSKVASMFLVVWRGPKEEFESEPCAVVVNSMDGGKVKFRPEWFDGAPRALPKKRPASRSSQIEPPRNAVFSPEMAWASPSSGRSPISSPSKTPKHRGHGFSPRGADLDDPVQLHRGSTHVKMPLGVSREINNAVTSQSDDQGSEPRVLVCQGVAYEIESPVGTDRTLPRHLREILRKWHDTYPLDPSPCAVDWKLQFAPFQLGASNGTWDRDGSRCEVTWFRLIEQSTRPMQRRHQYHALVLRMANGSDVLVRARHRFHPDRDQTSLVFLEPWLGLDALSETRAIAVSIYDKSRPSDAFSPDLFDLVSGNLRTEQSRFCGQDQDSAALPIHNKDGGSYRDPSMLPLCSVVEFEGTFGYCAPSESCNSSREAFRQNTRAPSVTFPLSEGPQVFARPAQPNLDDGHRIHSVRRLFGRGGQLQIHILNALEEWHSEHDGTLPHHLQIAEQHLGTLTKCSVFDRAGITRELSVFSVFVSSDANCDDQYSLRMLSENSVSYSVAVLHTVTDGDKLVALATPTTLENGLRAQYLLAWDGAAKQFETEVCAIIIHLDVQHREGPMFSIDMFDEAVSWLSSWVAAMNEAHPAKRTVLTDDQRVTGKEPDDLAAVNQSPKAELKAGRSSGPPDTMFTAKRECKKPPNESSGRNILANDICKSPSIKPGLRAKFVSQSSDNVRVFSLAGCDMVTIFRKAKEFYQDRDPTEELVLAWKIPGLEQERYVWEGCQDEYDILCEDLRKLTLGHDAVHEIEINLAGLRVKADAPDVDMKIVDHDTGH